MVTPPLLPWRGGRYQRMWPPPCLISWGHQTLYEGRVRWVRCVTHDVYLRLPISGSPVASIASVHTAPILHCQAAGSRPPRPGLCLAWPVSLSVVTNTTSSLAVLCHNNIIPILWHGDSKQMDKHSPLVWKMALLKNFECLVQQNWR